MFLPFHALAIEDHKVPSAPFLSVSRIVHIAEFESFPGAFSLAT